MGANFLPCDRAQNEFRAPTGSIMDLSDRLIVGLGQGLLLTGVLTCLPTHMDHSHKRMQESSTREGRYVPKHRPFHGPAMSGIMSLKVAACATSPTQSTLLYRQLGGKPAGQAVVDDFVWRVRADSRIKQGRA